MDIREIEAQAKALAPVIAAAVASAIAPLQKALADRDEVIAALSKRVDELPVDLAAVAALVPVPEAIPGKDAPEVDLDALALAAAALVVVPAAAPVDLAAVAALVPVPEAIPGKDAPEVDLDALALAAAALVVVPAAVDGKDAIDLVVLPAIDESKQYPRSTYAMHRGGLWKSHEPTNGMRGWECMVDGVAEVAIVQDGAREFSIALSKSSGARIEQKFALPVPIYKGVFRDGEKYEPHDNVTWAGSQWTCLEATTDKPQEGNKSWVLSVKRGRDGKTVVELPRNPNPEVRV